MECLQHKVSGINEAALTYIMTREKRVGKIFERFRLIIRRLKRVCKMADYYQDNKEKDIRAELKKIGLEKVSFAYVEDMSVQCLEAKMPEGVCKEN